MSNWWLAYWYANHEMSVLWNNVRSNAFIAGNGTEQGGVISPYLFTRYIRVLTLLLLQARMDVESAICLPIYLLMQMTLCYSPHHGMLCKFLFPL